MLKLYLGIDPGVSGGLAIVNAEGKLLHTERMPITPTALRSSVALWSDLNVLDVTVEQVWSQPAQGHSGAFTFGKNVGIVLGVLAGLGIDLVQEVSPQRWQQVMAARSGGDKNLTKRAAQALYPKAKITHAIADAILIAECGRRLDTVAMPENLTRRSRRGVRHGTQDQRSPATTRASH